MNKSLKKAIFILTVLLWALPLALPPGLFAQVNSGSAAQAGRQKYALVIGNSDYTVLPALDNTVNDADDVAVALLNLGFTVNKLINGTLVQTENSIAWLIKQLGTSKNNYCFFYYAGHGVESNGENYLVPVNADIQNETQLRSNAIPVGRLLSLLDNAKNDLNIVVLDACRDNPFGTDPVNNKESKSRGLATSFSQPANTIVVYSTGAGLTALDGSERNSLFTERLIANLAAPHIEVAEVFRRTGQEVADESFNEQIPAVYSQFFGKAFLGEPPSGFEQYTPGEPGKNAKDITRFWSVSACAGTSFVEPWLTLTARATLAPFRYSFLDLGVDFGLMSGVSGVKYNSYCPYAHAVFYWPFNDKFGAYAGAGGGYMTANYTFDTVNVKKNGFVADTIAGINLFNIVDISYTLRTNFSGLINKISLGYIYRF